MSGIAPRAIVRFHAERLGLRLNPSHGKTKEEKASRRPRSNPPRRLGTSLPAAVRSVVDCSTHPLPRMRIRSPLVRDCMFDSTTSSPAFSPEGSGPVVASEAPTRHRLEVCMTIAQDEDRRSQGRCS